MDSYLHLAAEMLRAVRRPLSPREIMNAAYRQGMVPDHLHGRTQHKTLQARLSENILEERDSSLFFRTEPGKFFLRKFITDETLPATYRTPIIARRRVRDLPKADALALDHRSIRDAVRARGRVPSGNVLSKISECRYHYLPTVRDRSSEDVLVWSFVIVTKNDKVLSYRQGRYREGRDGFMERRTIGFYNLVVERDLTLFDRLDHGILSSGMRAMSLDLDLPRELAGTTSAATGIRSFLYTEGRDGGDLLAIIHFNCPDWYEPLNRRLSLNDLHWMDVRHAPNDIEDFDPWSRLVLEQDMYQSA